MYPDRLDSKKVGLVLVSLLALLIVWVYVSSPLVVTVTGTGEVSVPATNATISFTLSSTSPSIDSAVEFVLSRADTMRKYLESNGVKPGDIAQSQVTEVPSALVVAGSSGYQATVSMAAKTSRVADVAKLIKGLYTNGASVVGQPVLSVDNEEKLDQQAFNSALSDAKKQASKIGMSNLKFIRKVVAISQVSSPSTSTSTTKGDSGVSGDAFKIVKAVTVTYKMW